MAININNNPPRKQYTASASQTNFAGTWRIEEAEEIQVYLTPAGNDPDDTADILTLTTDYTVTGVGVDNSFTVVLNSGASVGDVITIVGNIDFSSNYNFLTNQDFNPADFNVIFSKFDRELKQVRMELRNIGLKYQNSEQVVAKDLTIPELAANQSWRMNSLNNKIEAVVIGATGPGEQWYGVTTGTNTYSVTIANFTGYSAGETIFLQIGNGNTGASTININGLGVKALVNSNGIPLVSGDLVSGVTYIFLFHNDKYYLLGLPQKATIAEAEGGTDNFKYITPFALSQRFSKIIPSGLMAPFGGVSAPAEWLLCDGSAVSRTTYADLFAAIGVQWGAGDGSTTFNLPEIRGRGVIGAGNGLGLTGRIVGQAGGEEEHTLTLPECPQDLYSNIPYSRGLVNSPSEDLGPNTTGGQPHNNMPPFAVGLWIIKI
jgi:microcystin-dependent protein